MFKKRITDEMTQKCDSYIQIIATKTVEKNLINYSCIVVLSIILKKPLNLTMFAVLHI